MRAGVPARSIPAARAKSPEVLARDCGDERARFELAVPATLAWFEGHFPGHPVLPGVAQIGWAAQFAREAFGFPGDPLRIDRVKFLKPVRPDDSLNLELWRGAAPCGRVEWRFARGDVVCSRGRFDFAGWP